RRGGRPVLRDLRRRPPSPAASPDRRTLQVQDLCSSVRREGEKDGVKAIEAGGDRAVDARAALSARWRGGGLHAARVFERPGGRVRKGYPPVFRGGGRPGLRWIFPGAAGLARRVPHSIERAPRC